ncbi:MAG TPA: 4-hydroxybenzoate 3-monooxygenase [Candidatus Dormibacteraeota bacterium]
MSRAMTLRTTVAIIGAGPAGLLLAHLLHRAGVDSVVLENRSRDHIERRVRAGVLEAGAAQLLRDAGVGERLDREGLEHGGIHLRFGGESHRIDFKELTGRAIFVYGQQEVVKDLVQARLDAGGPILFEAEAREIRDIDQDHPSILFSKGGHDELLECNYVVACDGSHGIGRAAMVARGAVAYERNYPHAWLGILAATPPAADELIYAYHERGFALHSMRSPNVSRLYLQVRSDETLDTWPVERMWSELRLRLNEPSLENGEILDIGITAMTSFVLEPMQSGRLFIAGDAAHIVPPTGAKGMNLALADVTVLAAALTELIRTGRSETLSSYTFHCLQRVWRAQYFSNFMTQLLHRKPLEDAFDDQMHLAQLRYVTSSSAASRSLAENYTAAATGSVAVAKIGP